MLKTNGPPSLCANSYVLIYMGYGVPENCTFQWQLAGKDIDGATSSTYSARQAGTYSVRIRSGSRSVSSQTITIENTINLDKPYLWTADNASNLPDPCDGSRYMLLNYNTGLATVEWFRDGKPFTEKPPVIQIHSAVYQESGAYILAREAGTYTARITNGSCAVTTEPLPFDPAVNRGKIPVEAYNYAQGACAVTNPRGSLFIPDYYGSRFNVEWYKDGKFIEGALQTGLFVTSEGTYTAKVTTKDNGCSGTSYPLTVKFDNNLQLWANHPTGKQTICEGSFIPLMVRSSAWPEEITFLKDGKPVGDGTTYPFKASESGTYTVRVRNRSCTATTEPLYLTVTPSRVPSITNASNCNETSKLAVQNPVEGVSYAWRRNSRTLYDVTGSTYSPKTEGLYSVVATKDGCSTESVPHTVNPVSTFTPPTLQINHTPVTKSVVACRQSVTLSYSDVVGQTYQWQKDGQTLTSAGSQLTMSRSDQSGTYTLLTSVGSCMHSQSATIKIYDNSYQPTIRTSGSTSLCPGQRVMVTTNSPPQNVTWQRDGALLPTDRQDSVTVTQPGSYVVRELVAGCETDQVFLSKPLLISHTEPATAALSGSQAIALDSTAHLTILLSGQPPFDVTLSDGSVYSAISSFSLTPAVHPKQTTTYTLREVRNSCGPGTVSGSADVRIIVLAAELSLNSRLAVKPIPASTVCDVTLDWPEAMPATLDLLNLSGQAVITQLSPRALRSHDFRLSVADLPTGIYVIRVVIGKQVLSRKLVKL
ncbi:T9SS type A sorting domain-containing protein [Spirosoma fluminis]